MYGEFQMNKSYQLFSFIFIFITALMQGCSEGGSSETNIDKTPIDPVDVIPNETENEFVIASFKTADDMRVGESTSIQLSLENLELKESKLLYFEWQNLDGDAVNDGSISPAKGIIRPQESSAQFFYEYIPKTEGIQLLNLILTSENKKEIIKNIELSVEE